MLLRRYWRWIKVNILAVNSHGEWLTSWCPGTANVHASLIKPFTLDERACPFFLLSRGAGLAQKRFALVSFLCFSSKLAWITRTPHSLWLLPSCASLAVTTAWRRRAPGRPWSPAGRCCSGPARGVWSQTGGIRLLPPWTGEVDTESESEMEIKKLSATRS